MNISAARRVICSLAAVLLMSTLVVGLYAAALHVAVRYVYAQSEPFADVPLRRGQPKAELLDLLDDRYARGKRQRTTTEDQLVYVDGEHQLTLTFEDDRLSSWTAGGPLVIRRIEASGEFNLCCGESQAQSPAEEH